METPDSGSSPDDIEIETDRSYICGDCYFIYDGYWDCDRGRQPCPACGKPYPEAADTTACAYWEMGLGEKYGSDFFKKNYWWCPKHVTPAHAQDLAKKPYRKVESLPVKGTHP